ncbi:MAG: TraC family protein, partial [Saezia sp.]
MKHAFEKILHKLKPKTPLATQIPPPASTQDKDAWEDHALQLNQQGISEPGLASQQVNTGATLKDEAKLYESGPSFTDLLPWVEYLPESKAMLLDDGQSVAAFYELLPIGTEGREASWLKTVRDALENALQDSFDEEETDPWVIQLYAQDETSWDTYLRNLKNYVQDRAKNSPFTEEYLKLFERHLYGIAKP